MENLETDSGLKPMIINLGPQHPSTHGVLRVRLALDGERVKGCEPIIGYLHTGIEKNCEDLTYNQAITLTDRMDYLSPITNNFGYVLAVEQLLSVEVPKRTQYIRVMFAELSRIASHLVWLGTSAMDMGAMSIFFYCLQQREKILDLFEAAAGTRLNPSYFRVGGLLNDLPPGFIAQLRAFLDEFPKWLKDYHTLLDQNPLWLDRLKNIAVITAEEALDYGFTGPALRGSGVDRDLRRTNPYSSYEDFEFDVPLGQNGDAYDRYACRLTEMDESRKIIYQVLDKLPEGAWHVDSWKIYPPNKEEIGRNMEALIYHFKLFTEGIRVPKGEVYVGTEGPKGEIGYYLVSDGSGKPYRVRVRGPSFYNLQALPLLVKDRLVADVVTAIGSIDIVLGEVDR